MGERLAQLLRPGGGRRDDDVNVASLIRRGRPPAHRGSSAARPLALNAWITSRTVSSSAATSRAIAGTSVPDADAIMIIARRTRIDPCLPAPHDLLQPPALPHRSAAAPAPAQTPHLLTLDFFIMRSSVRQHRQTTATTSARHPTRRTFVVSALAGTVPASARTTLHQRTGYSQTVRRQESSNSIASIVWGLVSAWPPLSRSNRQPCRTHTR